MKTSYKNSTVKIQQLQEPLRVPPELFMELIERVGPRLQKQDTFWRKALDPRIRFALALRYMATGNSYKSLQW